MKSFKDFGNHQEFSLELNNIIELMEFEKMGVDTLTEETLDEFKMPDITGALKTAGFHVKKGRGLMQIIAASGTHMAKILYHAVKAAKGDEASVAELKKLLAKKITKEDIIDVLLKIDQLTLHALTGPIHAIEAITGWHIAAAIKNVRKVSDDIKQKVVNVIDTLKTLAKKVDKAIAAKVTSLTTDISNTFKDYTVA